MKLFKKKELYIRMLLILILIILPIGSATVFLYYSFIYVSVLKLFLFVYSILCIISLLNLITSKRKNETYYSVWSIIIIFIPIYGAVLYNLLGSHSLRYNFRLKERREKKKKLLSPYVESDEQLYYLRPVEVENYKIYSNGLLKYNDLIKDIQSAKKTIYIQYFIIYNDYVFKTIVDLLKEKVKQGVKVKISTDYAGSIALNFKKFYDLEKFGIEVLIQNKMNSRIFIGYMNHRNHKKIVIIDDDISYFGGMNLAIYYGGISSKYGYWEDMHFRFSAKSMVSQLESNFNFDWKFDNNKNWKNIQLVKNEIVEVKNPDTHLFDDGPDVEINTFYNLLLEKIRNAKKLVYISMPYPIYPSFLEKELISAKKRNIDVKVIAPGISDKKSAFAVSYIYLKRLNRKGIEVYRYSKIFLHSKVIFVDDEVITGTSNTDYRSFFQHYETNLISSNKKFYNDLMNYYSKYLENSYRLEYKYKKIFGVDYMIYLLCKLVSPML